MAATSLDASRSFAALFEAGSAPMMLVNCATDRIVAVNDEFERETGRGSASTVGRTPAEAGIFATGDDAQRVADEVAAHGICRNLRIGIRTDSGDVRSVLYSAKPVVLDGVAMDLASWQDVTEQERIQDALLHIAEHTWLKSGDEVLSDIAAYLAKGLGFHCVVIGETTQDLAVKTLCLLLGGRPAPNLTYSLSGTPCEMVMYRQSFCYPSGVKEQFPDDALLREIGAESYAGIPLRDSQGTPLGIIAVLDTRPMVHPAFVESFVRVVAPRVAVELERRRTAASLRQMDARYKALMESATEHIFMLDLSGRYIVTNAASCAAPYRPEPGKFITETHPPEVSAIYREKFEQVVALREAIEFEHDMPGPDGTRHHLDTLYPVVVDGQLAAVGGICRDITESRRIQEQLMQADKLVSLGMLTAGVSHEINNPTNFITLSVPMLNEVWNGVLAILDEKAKREGDFSVGRTPYSVARNDVPMMLDSIGEGANRIRKIVAELKNFARFESSATVSRVDVNEVVRSAVTLVGGSLRAATGRFTVTLGDSLPAVAGNPRRLQQVVVNLLQNACQAIPTNEKCIVLRTGYDAAGDRVEIAVEDEGVGMTQEVLKRLKEPFFTTKRGMGGTGLGLAVSHRIVASHKGSLDIESAPGVGTRVKVSLPAWREGRI